MRSRPALLAALALSALSALSAYGQRRFVPVSNANPAVTINVDAAVNRHSIDPRIYGVAFADAATLADLGITINRWGGNAMSRYNWAISTANRCKDYYFENIPDSVSSGDGSNGKSADDFIGPTLAAGAQAIMTIPMMGMLPKDRTIRCGYLVSKYGAQQRTDPYRPDCGNGKTPEPVPYGTRILNVNDPADTSAVFTSTHQANWIQHMVATWGTASNGGVRYYALDNEPVLWSFDHWDVHPSGSTYDEIWSKWQDYGAVIKGADPTSLTTGIEEWGWSGYFDSGIDAENNDSADRDAHGGVPLAEWLLQQAQTYEQTHGLRILDVAALHFYPQSGEFSNAKADSVRLLRNRSTRSLWDPNYVDESWIGGTGIDGGHVRLIPRLKEWVANDYPGTQIAITEYNWGAEGDPYSDPKDPYGDINGGTAQADILGIFGREALQVGVRWTSPPATSYVYKAFKMYRNYDGAHSTFGDLSVSASGPDPDHVATFAALRSSDGALTVMIVAKDLSSTTQVTVNLANYLPSGAPAQQWQLDAGNAIAAQPSVAIVGSSLTLTVPSPSVTLLVVPGSFLQTPAGVNALATSTSAATVTWTAVPGATGYQVYRSSMNGAFAPAPAGNVASTTFNDSGLTADTTYLYEVRATAGAAASPLSALDATTTTDFASDPVGSGTIVRTSQIATLRVAVNAMRAARALGAQAFTDDPVTTSTPIRALHITELRTALDDARAALGLPAIVYTDPTITAGTTPIRAAHIVDLRNGVK